MIKHIKTVEEFDELIKQDKVLVDFYATWCGPCNMLAPVLEEIQDQIEILKVDVDDLIEIARRYDISSIPTLLLISKGNIIKSTLGYKSKNELLNFIK